MNFKISNHLDPWEKTITTMSSHEKLYSCDAHRTTLIVSTLVPHGSNEIHPWRQPRKNSPRSISSSIQWNPSDAGLDHVKDLIFFRIDILPTDAVNIEWCAFLPSRHFFWIPIPSALDFWMGYKNFEFLNLLLGIEPLTLQEIFCCPISPWSEISEMWLP